MDTYARAYTLLGHHAALEAAYTRILAKNIDDDRLYRYIEACWDAADWRPPADASARFLEAALGDVASVVTAEAEEAGSDYVLL